MASEENPVGLSSTVLQVFEKFIAAVCADVEIEGSICDRLEELIQLARVPKPDEINAALFNPPPDGAT